jgi:hypothetical protein
VKIEGYLDAKPPREIHPNLSAGEPHRINVEVAVGRDPCESATDAKPLRGCRRSHQNSRCHYERSSTQLTQMKVHVSRIGRNTDELQSDELGDLEEEKTESLQSTGGGARSTLRKC